MIALDCHRFQLLCKCIPLFATYMCDTRQLEFYWIPSKYSIVFVKRLIIKNVVQIKIFCCLIFTMWVNSHYLWHSTGFVVIIFIFTCEWETQNIVHYMMDDIGWPENTFTDHHASCRLKYFWNILKWISHVIHGIHNEIECTN